MNKTIATIVIAIAVFLSPIVAMGVNPVREALLGLAPEDQILSLADKIDQSRVANDQKLSESDKKLTSLQQELDSAEQTIAEQKVALDEQKASQITKDAEQAVIAQKVDKQAVCSQLYIENKECSNKVYRNKDIFDDHFKGAPERKDAGLKVFNTCKEIIAQCG